MISHVPDASGGTEELHEITVTRLPEHGNAQCACGDFHETASGHEEVMAMQHHAAQHAASTGHLVREHAETDMTVGPRLPVG